jgi:hypothetical protein
VELRGEAAFGVKEVPEGTSIEAVRVGGAPGFFIQGPTGLVLSDGKALKVPGGVVLWQHGPITLRLESLLSKDSALRLANSVS